MSQFLLVLFCCSCYFAKAVPAHVVVTVVVAVIVVIVEAIPISLVVNAVVVVGLVALTSL